MWKKCFDQVGNAKDGVETEEDAQENAAHHQLPANQSLPGSEGAQDADPIDEKKDNAGAEDEVAAAHQKESESRPGACRREKVPRRCKRQAGQ